MRPTSAQLSEVKLLPEPIISDADLVDWDLTNHTFVITPTAAKRMIRNHMEFGGGGDFVLMTSGQPIYLGIFGSVTSSSTYIVPVILTDDLLGQCFMGWTNVPLEVVRMHERGDPAGTERLMALPIPATNVTLKIEIDPGYPLRGDSNRTPDVRDDKRIAAAVERLFGKARP